VEGDSKEAMAEVVEEAAAQRSPVQGKHLAHGGVAGEVVVAEAAAVAVAEGHVGVWAQ